MNYLDQEILTYMQEKMKAEINDLSRKSRWYGRVEMLTWMFLTSLSVYLSSKFFSMK